MAQSVSRSQVVPWVVMAAVVGAMMASSAPALAKKKRKKAAPPAAAATASDSATSPTDAPPPGDSSEKKPAEGAAQAADQERPKPVVDENQEAPQSDEKGNVTFTGARSGKGRIVVNAPPKEKVKVYLEGRYFGDTPITIYSVPKGDYIVEGTFVSSGKQVAKPVSVSENEEASVELAEKKAEPTPDEVKASSGFMSGDITPKRLLVTKVLVGATIVGLATCITFGILEKGKESDYTHTAMGTTASDNIKKDGQTDALLSNVGLFVAGGALIGAAVAAYPMFKKSAATEGDKPAEPPPTAFFVAPMVGNGTTGAAALYRF